MCAKRRVGQETGFGVKLASLEKFFLVGLLILIFIPELQYSKIEATDQAIPEFSRLPRNPLTPKLYL